MVYRKNRKTKGTFRVGNPIEENYRRAREMTENMPPAIMGVFAPDEMKELEDLRMEFVNTYREAWGSNAGLSTSRIQEMSRKELKESIISLRRMIEVNNNPPVGALGHIRYNCALCGAGIVQGTETGFDDEFACPSCARQIEADEKSGATERDTRDE